jgi:hypothetical protein
MDEEGRLANLFQHMLRKTMATRGKAKKAQPLPTFNVPGKFPDSLMGNYLEKPWGCGGGSRLPSQSQQFSSRLLVPNTIPQKGEALYWFERNGFRGNPMSAAFFFLPAGKSHLYLP